MGGGLVCGSAHVVSESCGALRGFKNTFVSLRHSKKQRPTISILILAKNVPATSKVGISNPTQMSFAAMCRDKENVREGQYGRSQIKLVQTIHWPCASVKIAGTEQKNQSDYRIMAHPATSTINSGSILDDLQANMKYWSYTNPLQ